MLRPPKQRGPRRPRLVAQELRSPLRETAYSLRAGRAYMLALYGGTARVAGSRGDYELEAPRLSWCPPGAATELRAGAGSRGELLELPEPVLSRALPASAFGDELRRLLQGTLALPLSETRALRRMSQSLAELREELTGREAGFALAAEHHVSLALIQVWRLARAQMGHAGAAPRGIADRFLLLVGLHAREHWTVEDYCRTLDVSRDRLGRIVKGATGLSPRAYIHRELHREARELLLGSGLQVSQIAFRLGFSDPAYFNRFFTRMEGEPPARLRRAVAAREGAGDLSFSAWP